MKANVKIIAMALSICLTATGCAAINSADTSSAAGASSGASASAGGTASSYIENTANTADAYTDRDLEQTADTADATEITLTDNDTVSITEAGTYVLSGSAANCTVRIEADKDSDKVQLVLNGVTITNDSSPAIYVVSADKCFITTAEGAENTLTVTGSFTADGDTNTDAVIFSKDDLVLNGLGSLTVSSPDNGISCKDDLKITGGTYSITSQADAIEANDSILICGGTFTINSGKDGLHCENEDDNTAGSIDISGGSFSITAQSDGVQGTTYVQIDGGDLSITAAEGLEATCIIINDGSVNIAASDDGVNATAKSTVTTPFVEINGGTLTVSMGQGDTDAIDANGSIFVNGGYIDITAPTSSFDYDAAAEFNGGTIVINGQEVSEIPQSMMGGGMGGRDHGGMGGRGGW